MKCIICDKCKKTIEDIRQVRTVTCARPLRHRPDDTDPVAGWHRDGHADPRTNDIIWEKDLCQECAAQIEAAIEGGE